MKAILRTMSLSAAPAALLFPFTACILLVGCGGELKVAPVSGTVTLDGAPLEKASVFFQPEKGRPSFGVTDGQGHYTLNYSMSEHGAKVGPCTVKISTAVQNEEDEGKPIPKGKSNDKVPARYSKEPIKVTVASKKNKFDFTLTTNP